MKRVLLLLAVMVLSGCRSTSGLEVVSGFNVNRYLGTWYEVFRYPHGFEKDLNSVTATYTLNDDGTIKVLNRGYNEKNKRWKTIEGVARFKDSRTAGWLKVSFFKPLYASYKIIYLDEAYTRAIVTGPSYNYLWILVRDPNTPDDEIQELVEKAESFGFEREKLIRVDHSQSERE